MLRIQKKLSVEENGVDTGEEVKWVGKINDATFFVLIGKRFDTPDLVEFSFLGAKFVGVSQEKMLEKHTLRLFIGPRDNLAEIPIIACEYFPFNESKETRVLADGYDFFFPSDSLFGADPVNYTKISKPNGFLLKKNPATCNGRPIMLY